MLWRANGGAVSEKSSASFEQVDWSAVLLSIKILARRDDFGGWALARAGLLQCRRAEARLKPVFHR
jgi:hypothetical protein